MAWTTKYVRADAAGGGDGTTNTNSGANGAYTLAEAITHSTTNTAISYELMLAGGTFANTTTARTLSGDGTTTAPNRWRGNNTAAGDIEADNTLTKPTISFTTALLTISGAHQHFSCLDIVGARSAGTQVTVTGGNCSFNRCRFENTNAGASSSAVSVSSGANVRIFSCHFEATTTATNVATTSVGTAYHDCVFRGGGNGLSITGGAVNVIGCLFIDNGTNGLITSSTGAHIFSRNTFYSSASDGIEISGTITSTIISNNLFVDCTGSGINNSTGANTGFVSRYNNAYYNNGGTETGFGDSPAYGTVTLLADPFTNAAGGDFSIVSASLAKGAGSPAKFENESFTSYLDIGAVQRQESGSGGGLPASLGGGLFQ